MRYFIVGFILGLALNLLPALQPAGGTEFYAEWHGPLAAAAELQRSPTGRFPGSELPPVKADGSIFILAGDGGLIHRRQTDGRLSAVSGNGRYYALFEAAGDRIEFFGIRGEPYWSIPSREYPHVSHNGKLLLLMNSDQSRVRAVDMDGNPLGSHITGRFATVVSFSKKSDAAGVGFLDGSFYLVDEKGRTLWSGTAPRGMLVKSIALSDDGKFAAVHWGNEKGDQVAVLDIAAKEARGFPLKRVHPTRTALHVSPDGTAAVMDFNRIHLVSRRGKLLTSIAIPPARTGMSSIVSDGSLYAAAYTGTQGGAVFLLFGEDGTVLHSRKFGTESFLEPSMRDGLILLRGSGNLYCYSHSHPRRG